MGLQSKLFRGDPKLEAAAISDPAHIMLGASGPHVHKIQTALMLLDGASISADEVQRAFYGASTAAAVLAYKQKRNIINRSYQTQADNIVGKMTMASLDSEMLKREIIPPAPVRIIPLTFWRVRPPRSPALLALLHRSRPLGVNFAIGSGAIGGAIGDGVHILPGPGAVLELLQGSTGKFTVIDGSPGKVVIWDPDIAKIAPDGPFVPGDLYFVEQDRQDFRVVCGSTLGSTTIRASTDHSFASLDVVVKAGIAPPPFHTHKPHDHKPCHFWKLIRDNPKSGGLANLLCSGSATPQDVINSVKTVAMANAPLAVEHLDWYLSKGKGNDFVEDNNIGHWLHQDSHIRNRLKSKIFPPGQRPKGEGHFTFDRNDYDKTKTEDFALSWGTIDRVDFTVDFGGDTVRVWFQDRYEFHPVFPGLYNFVGGEFGDFVREDNCIHAAAVEMKDHGAMDFWMKGENFVPLSLIAGP